MAKVVGPLHASEARGKMGGLVYNSWRGFATVKAKHAPAQPRTFKQLAIRAVAVMVSRAWQLLTTQAAWNTYATTHLLVDWTNSPKRLTGANWFVALTTRLLRMGIAQVDTPPIVAAPEPVTGFVATGQIGEIELAWTAPTLITEHVEFFLDGPHSPGRAGSLLKAKYFGTKTGDESTGNITTPQPGRYTVWARQLSQQDGQVSPFVGADADVT